MPQYIDNVRAMSLIHHKDISYDDTWSPYKIDHLSYLVFQSLQQNPIGTLSHMAKELGVSITVIKKRFLKMKSLGFFRKDREIMVPFLGKRMQSEVEAVYDPQPLGLERFHIFITGIRDMDAFINLDKFMSIHPYTHYTSGSFNSGASMYCQFDMPPNSKKIITSLLRNLQRDEYFDEFTIFRPFELCSNSMDFTQWDVEQRNWPHKAVSDDSLSLDSELDLYFHDIVNAPRENIQIELVTDRNNEIKFDITDMKLLRELTVNAKISTVEMSKLYKLDQSRISRRLSRLRQNVISSNLLYFDQSVFNLQYPTLFVGAFAHNDPLDMNSFQDMVRQSSLPFSSVLSVNPNKFVWMVTLPTRNIIYYSKFLWKHTKKLSTLNLDLSTSRHFYFLHSNYLGNGNWNMDKEYIVDKPLEILNSMKGKNV